MSPTSEQGNKILIGAFAGVVVIVIGIAYVFYSTQKPLPLEEEVANVVKTGRIEDCVQFTGRTKGGVDYEAVCRGNILQRNAISSADLAACERLENPSLTPNACKERIAVDVGNNSQDAAACSKIQDPTYLSLCLNTFWSKQARETNSVSSCANISAPSDRRLCEEYFFSSSFGESPSIFCNVYEPSLSKDCNTVKNIVSSQDTFLSKVTLCQKLTSDITRSVCEELVNAQRNNL